MPRIALGWDDFKVLSLLSVPARSVLLSFPASYQEACNCSIIHSNGIVTEEQLASYLPLSCIATELCFRWQFPIHSAPGFANYLSHTVGKA